MDSEEINDESDHDDQNSPGYYTRSKRRKLNKKQLEVATVSSPDLTERKRKNPIMFVPSEILQTVFKYVSHHELSGSIRLVNRRFKINAENVLNLAFKKIEKNLNVLIKNAEVSLAYTQDDMEIKCVSKLLNMLEILKVQYSIVMSTIWRYVYNEYYRTNRSCMYGGLLIDTHNIFLWKFVHYPNLLYAPAVVKDYALPQEVTRIIQMTKTFCVHFDKVNEEALHNCLVYSGCKVIDILDCAKFIQKLVLDEKVTSDTFVARYNYFFQNSWFIGLPISVTKEMEWNQKQRMMHMRLRRVVLAHNDMFLQQAQYERELILRPGPTIRIKKPGNNVYTGYGDVMDTFFYYGVMNDGAYIQKFHLDEDNDEDEVDEEVQNQAGNGPHANVPRNNSEEDIFYQIAHLGFRMNIEVRCPLSYAPLKILEKLDTNQQDILKKKHKTKGPTGISIVFECEGASYPRLPTIYEYHFKPKLL
ncbi:uncharacterized protein LOC108908796 [Anoplophora glabripennis]|uniref:uncharacterized protein LOC108908796 n=1 Tax=Anoplophora glabripennis TaxID=217634 RepID=UPI00087365A0|nr:uncharacterized protein LOC108908796 [Anoplophora glabripennis]